MIEVKQQAGNSGINFNAIVYDLSDPSSVVISGTLVIRNQTFEAVDSLSTAGPFTVFVQNDGSLTITHDADSYATLCWWNGTDLNVIRHV